MGNLLGNLLGDLLEYILQTTVTSLYRHSNDQPWREPSVWDDQLRKRLIKEIINQQSVGYQNILVLGPTRAGKSWYIDSAIDNFRNLEYPFSIDTTDDRPLLPTVRKFRSEELLHRNTVFCLSHENNIGQCINIVGSKLFVKSMITKRYLFNSFGTYFYLDSHEPECQIHCVTFIVSAMDIIAGVPECIQIKQLHRKLKRNYIPVVLVLTEVDMLCREVRNDITKMFRSTKVQEVIETASKMFEIELCSICPVAYMDYYGIRPEFNIPILLALRQSMFYVTDYLDRRQFIKVEMMLDENILPDNEDIQTMKKHCGRQSEKLKTLCGKICAIIKRKMYKDTATDVWPAWNPKSDKIVFVVEPTDITGIKSTSYQTDLELIEVKKSSSTFESEGHMVMAKERELLTNQTYDYIVHLQSFQKKISTYSKELMDKHKNITAIFPSIVKSVGYFKSGKHRLIETLCISIRVEKKVSGLIPLEEEPIETYLGQFPTDVIAGDFCLFGEGPNDFHENVKIGLAIHAGLVTDKGDLLGGTMGCFVKHKIFGLCCLTSAHIVLSQAEIQEVLTDGYREYDENSLKLVYQPVSKRLSQFGKVVAAACNEGQSDTPGVEVALIKIMCRQPISGSFPLTDSETSHTFTFNSGNVADATLVRPLTEVFKFGIETGPTFGLLGIPGVSVRYRGGLRLENQLVVMPKKDAPFAENGDSGSSAFIGMSRPGTEAVIGLVSGGFNSGQVLVTPIHAALSAVQCPPYLHRFDDVCGDSGYNDDISEVCESMECN